MVSIDRTGKQEDCSSRKIYGKVKDKKMKKEIKENKGRKKGSKNLKIN